MKKLLIFLLCAVLPILSVGFAEPADALNAPHLDYAQPENWCYWDEETVHDADLFFICPTVDMGRAGNLLGDVGNESYRNSFIGATNMELGIYTPVCDVYAPYYQQVTFPVYSMTAEEAAPYFNYAYEDVRAAFMHYLENADEDRPIVLAGFSQGAEMVIRLTEEFFADEAMAERLVAVYAIGWRLTEEDVARAPWLKPAQGETDTGVIIAFNSESEAINGSLSVPEGTWTYAINPLNWTTDATPADASLNLGACFTDRSGTVTKEIPQFCGAYLDTVRGALKVPGIDDTQYPGKIVPDGVYHLYDYQFFFRNLEENVAKRLASYLN